MPTHRVSSGRARPDPGDLWRDGHQGEEQRGPFGPQGSQQDAATEELTLLETLS